MDILRTLDKPDSFEHRIGKIRGRTIYNIILFDDDY